MILKEKLFMSGNIFTASGANLTNVLEAHQRSMLSKIDSISDLDQLTEGFAKDIVKQSLVEPIVLLPDEMVQEPRTEFFHASQFPWNIGMRDHFLNEKYPKPVSRIKLPFQGDSSLLKYCPNECQSSFPIGEVQGNTIVWDVIFYGESYDDQIPQNISDNIKCINWYLERVNKEVDLFNQFIPNKIKDRFATKSQALIKQSSVLNNIGIKKEESIELPPASLADFTKSARLAHPQILCQFFIQVVNEQFVEQLNQTNHKVGTVNNAIQST